MAMYQEVEQGQGEYRPREAPFYPMPLWGRRVSGAPTWCKLKVPLTLRSCNAHLLFRCGGAAVCDLRFLAGAPTPADFGGNRHRLAAARRGIVGRHGDTRLAAHRFCRRAVGDAVDFGCRLLARKPQPDARRPACA